MGWDSKLVFCCSEDQTPTLTFSSFELLGGKQKPSKEGIWDKSFWHLATSKTETKQHQDTWSVEDGQSSIWIGLWFDLYAHKDLVVRARWIIPIEGLSWQGTQPQDSNTWNLFWLVDVSWLKHWKACNVHCSEFSSIAFSKRIVQMLCRKESDCVHVV